MSKALYRKHRPKKLSEVVGQDHITKTLQKALTDGHISHAYLFTGPRGTGKTSVARILAHAVNDLAYEEDTNHLDIIEIDAASNRRIDEIRELKDRINIAPTSARYKVYIIDEVHMLTREAFNALLKTLEEPPEHAIFILATTEAHKLPATIISRTQRFSFKPVTPQEVIGQLKAIAEAEKLTVSGEAFEIIADHGNGSFRDSISLLDQVRNIAEKITKSDVEQALGRAPADILETIVTALQNHDLSAIEQGLRNAQDSGIQPAQLSQQLSQHIRNDIIHNHSAPPQIISLLRELLAVPAASTPEVALELALYEVVLGGDRTSSVHSAAVAKAPDVPEVPAKKSSTMPAVTPPPSRSSTPTTDPQPVTTTEQLSVSSDAAPSSNLRDATDAPTPGDWQDILDAIKSKHNTLYGIIRMAVPRFDPGNITLTFTFPFHHKRVSDAKNHDILSKVAAEITGQPVVVTYELEAKSTHTAGPDQTSTPASAPVDLTTITDIFGDAEVLD